MSEVTDALKQYWPYAVGGIVGLYLLAKFAGGGSAPAADNTYASILAAQSAGAAANSQAQAQLEAVRAQVAAGERASQREYEVNLATLELQKNVQYAGAFNQFQQTQSAMAQSIGSSTAQIIGALNQPGIAAMNAAAYENAAAMQAAAEVAGMEFLGQSAIVDSISGSVQSIAGALSNPGAFGAAGDAANSKGQTQQSLIGTIGSVARGYR